MVVEIEHAQGDFGGRPGGEQQIDFAAEAEILRALSDVEAQLGFALSGIARVELQDAVLEFETREAGRIGCLSNIWTSRKRRATRPSGLPASLPAFGLSAAKTGVMSASFWTLTRKCASPARPARAWLALPAP